MRRMSRAAPERAASLRGVHGRSIEPCKSAGGSAATASFSCSPSMTGISRSTRATANARPAAASVRITSSAASPESASVTVMPHAAR